MFDNYYDDSLNIVMVFAVVMCFVTFIFILYAFVTIG